MTAYVLSEVEILNEDSVNRYKPLAKAAVEQFGGRYLVRDGVPETLEGEFPSVKRLVVVEFPDLASVHAWYTSPIYADALAAANGALARRLLAVDGI